MSLIIVCSGKGAPGATYTAVNLAASFARAQQDALLLDFDPAGGDIGAALGLDPRRGLHPLTATAAGTFHDTALESEIELREGIRAINGFPEASAVPEAEVCRSILRAAQRVSPTLIVDLGRVNEANASLAADADLVLVATRTDLVSVLGADRALRILATAGVSARHVRLVVNGVRPMFAGDPLEVSRTLGIMTLGVVPNEGRAARAARAAQRPVSARRTHKAFDRLRTEVCRIPETPRVEGRSGVTRIGAVI